MQGTKIRLMVGGLLLAAASSSVHSEALQPDPAWQEGKLDNGFSWQLLATPQRPSDRIELRMIVSTGSLVESNQQVGFAHLLPRLALTHSDNFTASQLQSFWQQSIDPQRPLPPAVSSYDYTAYNLSLPNNRPELLKEALQWLANTAGKLNIDSNTVISALQSPENLVATLPSDANDPLWRLRLKGSTMLGHEPGQGPNRPVDTQQLKAFYQQWYTPDAMTLYVVGNVDSRSLSEQINKAFADLKGKRETPATLPTLAPLPTTPINLIAENAQQDTLSITWDVPWQPIRDSQVLQRYWKSDFAREALFSHLQQVLANSDLKGSVNLMFDCQVQYQRSQCAIHLSTTQANLNKALSFITTEMSAVHDDGVTQQEFDTMIAQKKDQLTKLFATYARTDTDVLMSQRLRSQQSGVVDISPETYQKLRQSFLATLSLDDLNQELHNQLSREPTLILRQPRGEPEENVKALRDVYNTTMGLNMEDASAAADAVPEDASSSATAPQADPAAKEEPTSAQ
ncbi:M16 family metallopeptidase [Hafnia alvei]|uniref:M16 family metallopeptidase n=1 Tax=Hafnia alvei TaxID=569 RepID=UPI0024A992CC|nr:pitrilysin family protein [Hafnia alvei]